MICYENEKNMTNLVILCSVNSDSAEVCCKDNSFIANEMVN